MTRLLGICPNLALALALMGCQLPTVPSPRTVASSDFDMQVLAEMNRLRANPKSLIPELQAYQSRFEGKRLRLSSQLVLLTEEGAPAVTEAIEFLRTAPQRPALAISAGMNRAAGDHVRDLGPQGKTGHFGVDGNSPSDRLRRHGIWKGSIGENLGFGDETAAGMIRMLLIDDGVADRSHRQTMFDPRFKKVGIACGPHKTYRRMCVIDFAEEYLENR